jgi:hypothetical protein
VLAKYFDGMAAERHKLCDSFLSNAISDVEIQIENVGDVDNLEVESFEISLELFEAFVVVAEGFDWNFAAEEGTDDVVGEVKVLVEVEETDEVRLVVEHRVEAEIFQGFLVIKCDIPA